jgi:asparagine synthase (glutamine-hydrolysing)
MGYRIGVEYRYPLLDRRIVEYMIKASSELLCETDHFRPLLRVLGEGLLPDEILHNNSKQDPVYAAWWHELIRFSGLELMDEAAHWHGDPDLSFVDFELLNDEMARFRQEPSAVDPMVLFKALVYIKAIHQFSVSYRGN